MEVKSKLSHCKIHRFYCCFTCREFLQYIQVLYCCSRLYNLDYIVNREAGKQTILIEQTGSCFEI